MNQDEAEIVVRSDCILGEGPLWNAAESALYWTDIYGKLLHRFFPGSAKHESSPVDGRVGTFAFRAVGGLVLAVDDRLAAWQWGEPHSQTIIRFTEIGAEQRFNDGKADAAGRFWAGAMGPQANNCLYRLNADSSTHVMLEDVTISNGIGWSPDGKRMYYTDTPTGEIAVFDFDIERGEISNRQVFAKIPGEMGSPDGLCVDAAGGVWTALWDGWRVLHFDPNGVLERTIRMPVQRPTSCAFGGADLDVLYITSARDGLTAAELVEQPAAGALFAVQVGVRGQATNSFAG